MTTFNTGAYPPGCTQVDVDRAQQGSWEDELDYEDELAGDDCWHEEYEIGWDGRGSCCRCGHTWWATKAQLEAEAEHQRQYQEWVAEQERPWRRFKEWVKGCIAPYRWRWRRKRREPDIDDECPF